jgi:multiple sugar transport system permease protein
MPEKPFMETIFQEKPGVWAPRQKKQLRFNFLYSLPILIFLGLLILYPLIQAGILSFAKITPFGGTSEFNGLDNYRRLLSDPNFWLVLRTTFYWIVGTTFGKMLLGLIAALILTKKFAGNSLFKLLIFLPWAVPITVAAKLWGWMYNPDYGAINSLFAPLFHHSFSFLGNTNTALPAIIVASIWHSYPFVMLMLLAGLQAIPTEIVEASRVDGANAFQTLRYITLPCIWWIIGLVTILQVITEINAFAMIFAMTGGGPARATETMGLYIYRTAFQFFDFETAAAAAIILLAIALIFITIYFAVQRRRAK